MAKVLVVDDDAHQALALSVRLRAAGYEVRTEPSAERAAEIILSFQPDVIILDIDMPPYSGLELHECLRTTSRGRRIPVIYLTASDSWVNRQTASRQGAFAFLDKLCGSATLLNKIAEALDCHGPAQPAVASA